MTEPTPPSQPENGDPTRATAPLPEVSASSPAPGPAAAAEPAKPRTRVGGAKVLAIAGIAFGLIGLTGVSFTAGFWAGHGGGQHRGHAMHQGGGQPGKEGRAEHRMPGLRGENGPRPARGAQAPSAPSSAPSSATPAPTP